MTSTLGYFLREARKRPARFLARRATDEVRLAARGLLAATGGSPYRVRLARSGSRPVRLFSPEAVDDALRRVAAENPGDVVRLIERAEAAARYEVEIFSHRLECRPPVDWHSDPISGRRWPVRFHGRYHYSDLVDSARASDIKVPWELSRLQTLPVLALAHRWRRDSGFITAAKALWQDWRASNPVGYGINWAVGMEVALRAISLVLTADLTSDLPAGEVFRQDDFRVALGEHGRFLFRNVEYSDVNGNHTTSCLVGLLILGCYLTEERESRSWRDFALAELQKEILLQTYPDGVCHEGSIPYHRLVGELFLVGALLARLQGLKLGEKFATRLERMLEFTRGVLKPSGLAPVWGDADDGRVFSFGGQPMNDHRHLLAFGAALLGREDLRAAAGPLVLDAAVILDGQLLAELGASAATGTGGSSSAIFPDGGFFVLRRGDGYAMVDCGDVGLRGRGGHGHNDALSLELCLAGKEVLSDTGCAAYTRSLEQRLGCLSAEAHNAPIVDGQEPAPLARERWPRATRCPVEVISCVPGEGLFVGRHYGYVERGICGAVERRVRLSTNASFRITDRIEGTGTHHLRWRFHLAEGWQEGELGTGTAQFVDRRNETLDFRWSVSDLSAAVIETPIYPTYANPRERLCLAISGRLELPVEVEFELRLQPLEKDSS